MEKNLQISGKKYYSQYPYNKLSNVCKYLFITIIMQLSQSHLIELLQQQLYQARENQKNLRRINNSLIVALESSNNSNEVEQATIKQLEKRWEKEMSRKIKQTDRCWEEKLNHEVKKRTEVEKNLELQKLKIQRSHSKNSQSMDLAKLRDNKMKHIQSLMDEIIIKKVPDSKRTSIQKQKTSLSSTRTHLKYKSNAQNISPFVVGCISKYNNTARLNQQPSQMDVNASQYHLLQTERVPSSQMKTLRYKLIKLKIDKYKKEHNR